MTCLLLYYRIQQQSGILARCILFFVAFHRIYMYVCFFLATTSLVNKDYILVGAAVVRTENDMNAL